MTVKTDLQQGAGPSASPGNGTGDAADPAPAPSPEEGAPAAPAPAGASIHERIGRIIAELPAIGKNQRNAEQGFNFRGIDDVLNALTPLLGKHGVYFVPDVLERVVAQRATRSGGTMYEVNLHVRYTFYGPAGDSVTASGWGEGTDMGDKATNKAMTGAMKYVLFQTFAIATDEASQLDSDRHSPEETVPLPPITPDVAEALAARISALPDPVQAGLVAAWKVANLGRVAVLPVDRLDEAQRLIAEYEAKAAEEALDAGSGPDSPAEPERAPDGALGASESTSAETPPRDRYDAYLKDDLIEVAKLRGVDAGGTKDELLERLRSDDDRHSALVGENADEDPAYVCQALDLDGSACPLAPVEAGYCLEHKPL